MGVGVCVCVRCYYAMRGGSSPVPLWLTTAVCLCVSRRPGLRLVPQGLAEYRPPSAAASGSPSPSPSPSLPVAAVVSPVRRSPDSAITDGDGDYRGRASSVLSEEGSTSASVCSTNATAASGTGTRTRRRRRRRKAADLVSPSLSGPHLRDGTAGEPGRVWVCVCLCVCAHLCLCVSVCVLCVYVWRCVLTNHPPRVLSLTPAGSLALASFLTRRPTVEKLRQRNIIRAGPHADPSLAATHRALMKQRQQDALSRAIKNRRSVEDLVKANIIKDPDHNRLAAQMDTLSKFLQTRPSIDQVKEAHLIQDVMMWSAIHVKTGSPAPRNCHTITLVGRKLFSLGGYVVPPSPSLTSVFDPDTSSWSQPSESGTPPVERYAHAAVASGRFIYVFGGYNETHGWLNDVHALDTGACSAPCCFVLDAELRASPVGLRGALRGRVNTPCRPVQPRAHMHPCVKCSFRPHVHAAPPLPTNRWRGLAARPRARVDTRAPCSTLPCDLWRPPRRVWRQRPRHALQLRVDVVHVHMGVEKRGTSWHTAVAPVGAHRRHVRQPHGGVWWRQRLERRNVQRFAHA